MANIRKSFNFRNGVQVDDDNFIVNANGLVGIGTSIPTEFLDVHGTAKITGLVTATNLTITGVSTFYNDVKVGSAITFNPSTGAVRATTFFGSAVGLTDIYAIAVDGWYINAGNISTTSKVGIATDFPNYSLQVGQDPLSGNGLSIDALSGNVNTTGVITASRFDGIGDNITDLNASAIASGTLDNDRLPQDISVSGIISAYSFTGFGTDLQGLNATNITSGTLNNSRLPQDISISGIITAGAGFINSLTNTNLNNTGIATLGIANASRLLVSGVTTSTGGFVGNVTGTATTATSLTGSPNITVANITSSNINNTGIITSSSNISQSSSTGVSTVSTRLYAESIGVGTNSPSSDIQIRRSSESRLQVTSDTAEAIVAVGRSTELSGSNGALIFGNTAGIYPYSNSRTLDVVNYDTGSLNYYLNYSGSGGSNGDFNWIYAPDSTNPLMTLTYQGNLGLGVTDPTVKLQVSGIANVSSLVTENITAIGAGTSTSVETLYIYGGKSQILNSDGTPIFPSIEVDENLNITTGISTFFNINVTDNAFFNGNIGIGTTNPQDSIQVGSATTLGEYVAISELGIGLGTSSNANGFFLDGLTKEVLFGAVSIGSSEDVVDISNNHLLYVEGDSEFNGNVGIGTTLATSPLYVVGDGYFTGIVTATTFSGNVANANYASLAGLATYATSAGYATTAGIATISQGLTGTPDLQVGIITATAFTSGIGVTNPVQITVSGNILTFNVVGVGSTTLLLY